MNSGRAIDHIGIASSDLDGLAGQFEGLGFTLTPRAEHPAHIGTANRLVQLADRTFLELISPHGPAPAHGPLNFGTYTRDFLTRREAGSGAGINLIVFRTDDRDADLARWQTAALEPHPPFDFQREATLPDGTTRTVRFELGFVTHPDIDALFFVCDNKAEAHFWKPEFQAHDNGAEGIEAVVLAADDPARHSAFLAALFGGEIVPMPGSIAIRCGPHRIEISTPDELAKRGCTIPQLTPGTARPVGTIIRAPARRDTFTPAADAGNCFIQWT